MTEIPHVLTRRDLATHYRIPVATWETWAIRGGGPPYHKVGRRCLYRREDVEAWFAARRVTSTSDYGGLPSVDT
jgi:hypothetical protein